MLEQLINYYSNGNKAEFARMIGLRPQTINSWLLRNTFDAELLYAKCDGVSASWLLSGKGDMLFSKEISEILIRQQAVTNKDMELVALSRELINVVNKIMNFASK